MCVGRERVSPAADEHAAFLECEDAARFHIFFLDMNGQEVDVSKFREWHEAGSFAGRFMVRNAETFKHMVSMSDPLRRNIPLVFRECSVTGACVNEFQLGRKADSAGVFQYSFRQTSQGDNWCIHKYGGRDGETVGGFRHDELTRALVFWNTCPDKYIFTFAQAPILSKTTTSSVKGIDPTNAATIRFGSPIATQLAAGTRLAAGTQLAAGTRLTAGTRLGQLMAGTTKVPQPQAVSSSPLPFFEVFVGIVVVSGLVCVVAALIAVVMKKKKLDQRNRDSGRPSDQAEAQRESAVSVEMVPVSGAFNVPFHQVLH